MREKFGMAYLTADGMKPGEVAGYFEAQLSGFGYGVGNPEVRKPSASQIAVDKKNPSIEGANVSKVVLSEDAQPNVEVTVG